MKEEKIKLATTLIVYGTDIVSALEEGSKGIRGLTASTCLDRPSVYRRLKYLKNVGIVESDESENYRINKKKIEEAENILREFYLSLLFNCIS